MSVCRHTRSAHAKDFRTIMKKLIWFLLGIIAGFIAAHVINKDPRGSAALAEVDARITEFTERMGDAYREQESTLSAIVDDAADAVKNAARKITD